MPEFFPPGAEINRNIYLDPQFARDKPINMPEQPSFKQSLGLVDATMIVAGSMIDPGYLSSSDITQRVGSAGWLVACG